MSYKKNKNWIENLHIVMHIGLTMCGSILFCLFIGLWLDKKFNSSGIFIFIFILFGIFGGANVCYREIISIDTCNSNKKV